MPSLRDLQQAFADAVLDADGNMPSIAIDPPLDGAARLAIYRTAIFANYRNALGATYPVLKRLVGAPFFHTAVDAFVRAHPSTGGDLNVYGDGFGRFLEGYAPAATLPYLADVARLEWAIDEAARAPDRDRAPERVLAELKVVAPDRLPALRFTLEPSCRLVASRFPIRRIWQVNQPDHDGDERVSLEEGADTLLVRRDALGVSLERIGAGEYAWLSALAAAVPLGDAIEAAQAADATFDLGSALRSHIASGTIASVVIA
jgi:hypothetical protein